MDLFCTAAILAAIALFVEGIRLEVQAIREDNDL